VLCWIYKSFRKACEKASINYFRFHDLRHTFARHVVMAGLDIVTVKELLGHKFYLHQTEGVGKSGIGFYSL
jgi:integrase